MESLKTVLNALVGGVRELACDRLKAQTKSTQTINKSEPPEATYYPLAKISDRGTPDWHIPAL